MLTFGLMFVAFSMLALSQKAQAKRLCPEWRGGTARLRLFRLCAVAAFVWAVHQDVAANGLAFAFMRATLATPAAVTLVALILSTKPGWLRRFIMIIDNDRNSNDA